MSRLRYVSSLNRSNSEGWPCLSLVTYNGRGAVSFSMVLVTVRRAAYPGKDFPHPLHSVFGTSGLSDRSPLSARPGRQGKYGVATNIKRIDNRDAGDMTQR